MYDNKKLNDYVDRIFKLLCGEFKEKAFKDASNICPNGNLRIIFSSTFADTYVERNYLIEVIYPKLQEKARAHAIDVVFVDMRFGVKDENTHDHLTWIACADQILRCCIESDGLFFVSLQSNKYGYIMIPKFIPENAVASSILSWNSTVQNLFYEWYKMDHNAVPPQFVLKNLTGDKTTDMSFWGDANSGVIGALFILREALQGIPFDKQSSEFITVGQSVTEFEVRLAIALDPSMPRCAWVHRELSSPAPSLLKRITERFCDFY